METAIPRTNLRRLSVRAIAPKRGSAARSERCVMAAVVMSSTLRSKLGGAIGASPNWRDPYLRASPDAGKGIGCNNVDMLRVLLVDDHAGYRSEAREILDGDRFIVVAEADGVASALVAITDHRPDLVVLDVQLGDGTAFDVLELMGASMPPTVLVSSRDPHAYGDRLKAKGVIGFIGKDDLDADALGTLVAR